MGLVFRMQVSVFALICKILSAMGIHCQRDNHCHRKKEKKATEVLRSVTLGSTTERENGIY